MTPLQQLWTALAINVVIIVGLAIALIRKARQQRHLPRKD